jgi:hypothetical protein
MATVKRLADARLPRWRFLLLTCVVAGLAGCGQTKSHPLGGGYFIEGEAQGGWLCEPGSRMANLRLVYRKDGKDTVVSRAPSYIQNSDDGTFDQHVYGDNLVYVAYEGKDYSPILMLYSPKSGNSTLGRNLSEVIADDDGVRCKMFSEAANQTQTKVFSADDLKKR